MRFSLPCGACVLLLTSWAFAVPDRPIPDPPSEKPLLRIDLPPEIVAMITRVAGNQVSFYLYKKGAQGNEITLATVRDPLVARAKFSKETKKVEPGEPVPGGLRNEGFANLSKENYWLSRITINDAREITRVLITSKKGAGLK